MSTIPLLPRYFIGRWQDHLDIINGTHVGVGEYHVWTPDWNADDPNKPTGATLITPASLMFVVMRTSHGIPHPAWRPLPHVFDGTKLKGVLSSSHPVEALALAHETVPITSQDTTFTFIQKLHIKCPVFNP